MRRVALASASTLARRLGIPESGRCFSSMSVGQPTPLTHPHLMGVGELTPGFSAREYAERRGRLAEKLPPHSVALLAAASPAHLPNTVIPYPAYRQDADFAYLTGVLQPGCVAMVARGSDAADCAFALFVPPRSERQETWNGARLCANAAIEYFGADEAFERGPGTTREILKRLAGADAIFADEDAARDRFVAAALGTAGVARSSRPKIAETRIKPLRPLVHALRWRKSRAEVDAMRLSVEADIAGFHAAMRVSGPGRAERDAAAEHERAVKLFGADRLAYPSVVGSGAGALVIHYAAMDALMRDGDVLLMDAGCERAGYVSDVTRTWPVSGAFTSAQADVYDAVLDCNEKCAAAAAQPGVSLSELHALSVRLLTASMRDLGVRHVASRRGAYAKYYPHSVGHWLGMDTHDTPSVSTSAPIARGCAFTVEPGLYFPVDDEDVPKGLRGVGVRIEDNLAVDPETGALEVLSANLPKRRDEQEALLGTLRARASG